MKSASFLPLLRLQRLVVAAIVVLASTLIALPVVAQSPTPPYYPPGSYTPFSVFEGVNSDGSSSFSFPTNGSPITVMGIVLNNPSDMLDSTPNFQPWNGGANMYNLGGQWQIFIQAYSDPTAGGSSTDFGGCEVWMGQNYGNLPWIGTSADSYTNSQWTAQLSRLNSPTLLSTGSSVSLQAGDVVAITGYGLEYAGMMNVNEQHQIYNSFTITALETGAPLPAPTVTTLGQLMNSSGTFYFDSTRQTGAEHLQGTLVQLDGVRLLSGTWAPNNTVVVTDGSLRQMTLHIGNNPNLTTAPTKAFNVTGILDQESTDGTEPGRLYVVVDRLGECQRPTRRWRDVQLVGQRRQLERNQQLELGQQAEERRRCCRSGRLACRHRNRHVGRQPESRRLDFCQLELRDDRLYAFIRHRRQAHLGQFRDHGVLDRNERQPYDHGPLAAFRQLGRQRGCWQQPDAFRRPRREQPRHVALRGRRRAVDPQRYEHV